MTETVDIHALAGAYALDAVDDLERAAFDRHLRDCQPCAVEVAELRETAAWLTHAVAESPPPRLRDTVMAEIGRTAQSRTHRAATTSSRSRGDRLRRWLATGVAAALLAVGVGAGTWTVSEQRYSDLRAENARIDAVLSATDARLVSKDMEGGRVTLVVSPSRNAGVAVLDGLRPPGAGKSYQLWMVPDGAAPRDLGVLDSGTGRKYIPELAQAFAITREPAGGSKTPTLTAAIGAIPL